MCNDIPESGCKWYFFFLERNFLHTRRTHFGFSLLQIKEDIRDVLVFLGYCTVKRNFIFVKTVLPPRASYLKF